VRRKSRLEVRWTSLGAELVRFEVGDTAKAVMRLEVKDKNKLIKDGFCGRGTPL
jgi:hypothetical protein